MARGPRGDDDDAPPPAEAPERLDKWLWHARVVRTRTLAQRLVESGAVRVNRVRVTQSSRPVRVGDVLTIAVAGRVRVLRLLATADRRGGASEAALLYEDLTSPPAMPEQGEP